MFGRKKRRISRLLIVEDEPLVAFDTEHFLRDETFEIVATLDRVADAARIIGGGAEIDLVLVDVRLADGNGLEVARIAHQAGIAVLFVTGDCPEGGRDVAAGCLAKPYSQRDLLASIAAIEALLEGRTPKRLPGGLNLFEQAA